MIWKFCEIWKSYGKRGPEEPKFCEILSHSVRYGMYACPAQIPTCPGFVRLKFLYAQDLQTEIEVPLLTLR